jgi:NAD-dependent deacetylase
MDSPLDAARTLLDEATTVVVLTGAGISTASGIPDFRGPEGVWTKDPNAEMLSDFETWVTQPTIRTAAWQSRRRSPYWSAQSNPGHHALVTLEQRGVLDTLVTQNIDRLHHKAGSDPEKVVEIHGNGHEFVCLECGARGPIGEVLARVEGGDLDPTCVALVDGVRCEGILKSATISFGQSLVPGDLARAQQAAMRCDLLLAIGSTLSVYPIADMVPTARSHGAAVIILNGSPTAMDSLADVVLRGDISEMLVALLGD